MKRKVLMVIPLWLFPAWILRLHWQGDWSTKSINTISPIKKRKEGERAGKKWCIRDERAQAGLNFWDPVVRKLKTPISCPLISHLPAPFLEIRPSSASHCKAELTCSLSGIRLVPATPILLTVQCGQSSPLCWCVLSVLTAPTVLPFSTLTVKLNFICNSCLSQRRKTTSPNHHTQIN